MSDTNPPDRQALLRALSRAEAWVEHWTQQPPSPLRDRRLRLAQEAVTGIEVLLLQGLPF